MKNYTSSFESENYYHIYNHAVGKEKLFIKDDNYFFFLKKYSQYILPVADTFAYCLMPNHFHFAIRVRNQTGFENLSGLISQQFSNLFNSYAKAFNKQHSRF